MSENQAPDIKTEIVHEGEKVTIRLFHDEKIGTLPEYPSYIVTSEGRVYSWNVHRFLHTKAWHAPDGRIVLKFPKRYLTKDDLQYFEN